MSANDVDRAVTYLDRCAGGLTPTEVNRAWAERSHELSNWLDGIGFGADHVAHVGGDHARFAGSDAVTIHRATVDGRPDLRGGAKLWAALSQAVAERGVTLFWESPAERLLTDASGRVTGVLMGGNETRRLDATEGVILTTGGYGYNEELRAQYLKAPFLFYGTPAGTGDGVRMAQAVGADLWHMNLASGGGVGRFPMSEGEMANIAVDVRGGGYVIVDQNGRRYADESRQELTHAFASEMSYFDAVANEYPRAPSYWLFDEHRMRSGALGLHPGQYAWTANNLTELNNGWIARGSTVAEAAERAGHPAPAVVRATVEDFNTGCGLGIDEFGRAPESLASIDRAPYYCVVLHPGGSNTQGGPRRDAACRVLNPFGEPIAGLFSAGELGQWIGEIYPAAGAAISDALCSGQIAVESALLRA